MGHCPDNVQQDFDDFFIFLFLSRTLFRICNKELGLTDATKITDAQLSASSQKGIHYSAKKGRLNGEGWCADEYKKTPQWFQVDFNDTFTITSVSTTGSKNDPQIHVKTFALKYSYDNVIWHNYTCPGKEVILKRDQKRLPCPITVRLIRIYPRTWNFALCMRVEFYGCTPQEDCTTPVGMEDGRIKKDQINASSFRSGHNPFNGRLHNRTNRGTRTWGAWCSDQSDPNTKH
ncbi:Hypothetical predicted protein, partial [Paramuricea clavata]